MLVYAAGLLVVMTALIATDHPNVATCVLGLALLGLGVAAMYRQPWAMRLFAWLSAQAEQPRQSSRPRWQTMLIIAALVLIVALIVAVRR